MVTKMPDKHTSIVFDLLNEGLTPLQVHNRLLKAATLAASMIGDDDHETKRRSHLCVIDAILSRHEETE